MALNHEGSNGVTESAEWPIDPDFTFTDPPADPAEDLENAEITFPDPTNPDPIDPDIINPAVIDPDDGINHDEEIDPDEDIDPLLDPEVPDTEKP